MSQELTPRNFVLLTLTKNECPGASHNACDQ